MRWLAASALAAFCMTGGFAANAQVSVDVSKITCDQFVAYKVTNPKYISIWISGYYHGTQRDMVLDTQKLIENADKLQSYCLRNPDLALLEAVGKVIGPLE